MELPKWWCIICTMYTGRPLISYIVNDKGYEEDDLNVNLWFMGHVEVSWNHPIRPCIMPIPLWNWTPQRKLMWIALVEDYRRNFRQHYLPRFPCTDGHEQKSLIPSTIYILRLHTARKLLRNGSKSNSSDTYHCLCLVMVVDLALKLVYRRCMVIRPTIVIIN